ncbi:hypothetical protein A2482_02340 [Candidatus Falkowbacteria bacterium RIFOXYC2_FULL_48_21]|uniref:Uncharacterized protein n=1 Tax=Candidatus Falkowbacteria bacterium RIFOXYC2_FULL_48_21 TaxID=1798005 RepID=A0A1F5TG54_9BACT|nr:MAG: hypothetical protein A2482_02340 [Candidatus Falkowbacteria bacterium RIFOXYC2_FULL_48_21]
MAVLKLFRENQEEPPVLCRPVDFVDRALSGVFVVDEDGEQFVRFAGQFFSKYALSCSRLTWPIRAK